MTAPLEVVIVDDEPLARQAIREFVAHRPDLRLAGEAADGRAAVSTIERTRPHLVFLDVRLPGATGLDVVSQLTHRPAVVFTTAYDEFAIGALQAGAVDYVVKPFGPARLAEAVARVRARLAAQEPDATIAQRLGELVRDPRGWTRVFVRSGNRIVPVALADVSRIEASDDYVSLHVGDRTHLLPMTMGDIERRLPADRFLRVHRSHILNADFIARIEPATERNLQVVMRDGSVVRASRAGSQRLRALVR